MTEDLFTVLSKDEKVIKTYQNNFGMFLVELFFKCT